MIFQKTKKIILFILLALSVSWFAYGAEGVGVGVIRDIVVTGNHRISKDTILSYADIGLGQKIQQDKLDKVVKALYGTEFFKEVNTEVNGGIVNIKVTENPLVSAVFFENNKNIKDQKLNEVIKLKPRAIFSQFKLQTDIKKIIEAYHNAGRYGVKVTPKIIELEHNRINLIYVIDEGIKAKIKAINFFGNEVFSSNQLRGTFLTKEARWYRFFSSIDIYDSERLKIDSELLRRFYLNKGYIDYQLTDISTQFSQNKDAFYITFKLYEGAEYAINNISVTSQIKGLDIDAIKKQIKIQCGNIYNQEQVDDAITAITEYLGKLGYVFISIDPVLHRDTPNQKVDIEFVIKESQKAFINKINISGNTKTLDRVIRREFRIAEGDAFNIANLQRSEQRIKNLGYFNKVTMSTAPTQELDKVDVNTEVEEMSTGSVDFKIGYGDQNGAFGGFGLSENNFLGKGQITSFDFTKSKKTQDIQFTFIEPRFLDRDLAAGFDVFISTQDREDTSSFSSRERGVTLKMGYNLTEYLAHAIRYTVKTEKLHFGDDASIFISSQRKKANISMIGHTLSYNRLDDVFSPTSGYAVKFNQDLAGVGGDIKYLQNTLKGSHFYPIVKKRLILGLTGEVGNISGYGGRKVRPYDSFFLGSDNIKGFDYAGIGPRDKKTLDALGGKNYYSGKVELISPIGESKGLKIRGILFFNFANLWGTDIKKADRILINKGAGIRTSVGPGVIWISPLGPIGVFYGVPLSKRKYDDEKKLNLIFGTTF